MFRLVITFVAFSMLAGCVTEKSYVDSKKQVKSLDFNKQEAAQSRLALGIEYLKQGNLPQAKLNLDKALSYAPNSADVHNSRAYYFQAVGDAQQAKASYLKALALKPNNPDTLNNYAVFLCQTGKVAEAKAHFKQAIKVPQYSQIGRTYLNLAYCEIDNAEFESALSNATTASKYDPKSTEIMLVAASLHYAFGNISNAVSWFQELSAVSSLDAKSLVLGVLLAKANKQIANAQQLSQRLLAEFPNSKQATFASSNDFQMSDAEQLRLKVEKKYPSVTSVQPQDTSVELSNSTSIKDNAERSAMVRQGIHALNAIKKEHLLPEEEVVYDASATPIHTVVERTPWLNIKTPSIDIPTYRVQSGENLYRVSIKFNIQIPTLMKWNKLKKQQVNAGELLYIRNPAVYHVVETDEKLSVIADRLNVGLDDIMRWHDVSHDGLVKSKTKIIKIDPEQFK